MEKVFGPFPVAGDNEEDAERALASGGGKAATAEP